MKIVINRSNSPFGLSHKAIMCYAELSGLQLVTYRRPPSTYWQYRTMDDADWSATDIARDDLHLVRTVEKLGSQAGDVANVLAVVEIPDGVEYEIWNLNGGWESIHEKHRVWE